MSVYDYKAQSIEGKEVSLSQYKDKVLIIVNTASKCGFTPQYEELETLYKKYKGAGLEVLGFPCNQFAEQEPGSNQEVQEFCKVRFGVTFPLFEKIDVRGKNAHPLFQFLTKEKPFKGFDPKHPIAATLENVLKEKFPEFLNDDSVKWNFTKFLVDKNGTVVSRYEPTSTPLDMENEINRLLAL